jgi:hypothetical protein
MKIPKDRDPINITKKRIIGKGKPVLLIKREAPKFQYIKII